MHLRSYAVLQQGQRSLDALPRDGRRVVVGGDDDVGEVWLSHNLVEELAGVGEPKVLDQVWVRHEAVAPAHGERQLPTALNKEEGGRRDLRTQPHISLQGSAHVKMPTCMACT